MVIQFDANCYFVDRNDPGPSALGVSGSAAPFSAFIKMGGIIGPLHSLHSSIKRFIYRFKFLALFSPPLPSLCLNPSALLVASCIPSLALGI